MYVIVNGLPGSGKTTLAVSISKKLGWPVLEKDLFKEVLFDSMGVKDRDWSKKLGSVSIELMYRLAMTMPNAILDSVFDRRFAPKDLKRLQTPIVEVYCDCPPEIAAQRFSERQRSGRYDGHVSGGVDFTDWISKAGEPLAIGATLRVDTTKSVNICEIVSWISNSKQMKD